KLEAAGITSIEKLADMTPEQLVEIPGIGEKMVEKIHQSVAAYFEALEAGAGTEAAAAEGAAEATPEVAEGGAEAGAQASTEEATRQAESTEPIEEAPAEEAKQDESAPAAADGTENPEKTE